jgi:SulP family sulfate permease
MVQVSAIGAILSSGKADAAVLAITFGVTVAIDLVAAVALGLALAGLLALRAVARSSQLERETLDHADYTAEQQELLAERIVAFKLEGALFFGAAHRFLLELSEVADVSVVILRMSRVSTIDATGALMLDDAISRLEKKGIVVLLSGIKPGHERVLDRVGSANRLRELGRVFTDTPDAIHEARAIATR